MKRLLLCCVLWGVSFAGAVFGAATQVYRWPDAPPVILREDLFGIRFRLVLQDKGAVAAEKFLRAAWEKDRAPEVKAYVAWVSLWPAAWGVNALIPPAECERVLLEAIEEGSAVAADVLARARLYGQAGLARDEAAGVKLLDLAVERGLPRALARRGSYRIRGQHGLPDAQLGYAEVRRAAALGSAIGLVEVAESFERDSRFGVPMSGVALEYYYLLALENDGLGWKKLQELAEKKVPRAALLHALAKVRFANEGGFIVPSVVRRHLAFLEKEGQDEPRAQVELGVAKLRGGDFSRRDVEAAKRHFERALAHGNDEARFFLAYMRVRGLAGPQDLAGGLQEMTALADAGNVRATSRLGYFYYWGTADAGKIPKDPAKAFHYARMAAEAGSKPAAMNLAHCYKHGIGTKENYVLAAKLYWIATDYGYYGAKEDLVRQLPFAKVP
jgi:TPR repeat protein